MRKALQSITLPILAIVALATTPAMAADNPKIADDVMALARAQWAAEIAGKPVAQQIATVADDYTEINPSVPIRLDGKEMNARFYEAGAKDGSKPLVSDMVNPKVQVDGDTAILTYNFVGMVQAKDGTISPNNALSTRVYAKIDGKWQLVHGHFTVVK